ncbi:MAG: D-glycero-beta-D-manno-heptose-1,7-bisphosphate 7-phosphatase [Ferrovum sp. 37-45-19]|jgi:D-glycero-D-manno-heptose 1,7-bisphosphate phosphatase|uniref:D-glycero-beta-D-manno-heptose 1,7-bisphosphate 7-phosphatase n=1 Tax=Ferrovum sp. JA12 TaxID=1356299 RepID=UPI00070377D0|nr:D-glycero-beta-D-manno-heptose 1,7-bisphosphate 7-phosphatase [Ferrovum sp. JA12]OYV80426.1 MAG: D-glycero-beta-D-manno-heptose-1,7-bisphosphate 7-phosphatase [Ferrovum sp. 21-44-67]OYV94741.1 MAG: D-glycero-beta-D-manno-heptose-1,7-bisphosphate 7-phosphatase [Ferrovum sp. 37-45-19]OZB31881.1 MAG: D-glycero-beta-D-manno-heptose-1,7-bisphosphate 7-phosphatase [Ferrovum sp. 34-44-207]HQT81143.1 D-glycero-beta-D-manno-heptose 1,7-bisphosphate 7-phosphatase [Ferrovaceae bacterium]KRH79130.1 D-g
MPNTKLIILDRDGVINYDSDKYIKSPEEWKPLPGSLEAIARLNQAGYQVVIATNQSGVARGFFDMSTLNAIHNKMIQALSQVGGRIDGIFFCPHSNEANCNCRKPKTGLFEEIARVFNISLKHVPAIGDSLRDLQAASLMQALPILVLTGKGEKTLKQGELPANTVVENNLASAVEHLINPS